MKTIRRSGDRGLADHGWLKSRHSFSFAEYYDPEHMGYRSLRVINDDIVAGGGGFGMHPHRDMEIISYILSGALRHQDSLGNSAEMRAGEVQRISAGAGVLHSEFNASTTESVHFLQIWIVPNQKGGTPAYGERSFAEIEANEWCLVASGDGREGSLLIRQDADVWLAKLDAGAELDLPVREGRGIWCHLAEGGLRVDGELIEGGDALMVEDEPPVKIRATQPSQVICFDLA